MSFVKMPQDDYVAMCNKLRSMLNETDKYTSKDFIEKMDELIVDIEEGGNPNYVETIEGTLENPFGVYSISELAAVANSQNYINMFLRADATALGLGAHNLSYMKPNNQSDYGILFFGGVYLRNDVNDAFCSEARYNTSGLSYAAVLKDGSQASVLPYASQIPTTLTIIHHPLPSQS